MIAPDYSGLQEDLQAEYMELMEAGNRAAFDFALENSDKANCALQALAMDMMTVGEEKRLQKLRTTGLQAAALSVWTLCARQSFLDVVEKEVAPLWAEQEMSNRIAMYDEMREEQWWAR